MKRILMVLGFVMGTYNNALSQQLPSLEFETSYHVEKTGNLDIAEVNHDIVEFLAKNLLLDKVDILVRETSDIFPEEAQQADVVKMKLEKLHSYLKAHSILVREKLDRNFKEFNALLDKFPSVNEKTALGERIIIQIDRSRSIEISYMINS